MSNSGDKRSSRPDLRVLPGEFNSQIQIPAHRQPQHSQLHRQLRSDAGQGRHRPVQKLPRVLQAPVHLRQLVQGRHPTPHLNKPVQQAALLPARQPERQINNLGRKRQPQMERQPGPRVRHRPRAHRTHRTQVQHIVDENVRPA